MVRVSTRRRSRIKFESPIPRRILTSPQVVVLVSNHPRCGNVKNDGPFCHPRDVVSSRLRHDDFPMAAGVNASVSIRGPAPNHYGLFLSSS